MSFSSKQVMCFLSVFYLIRSNFIQNYSLVSEMSRNRTLYAKARMSSTLSWINTTYNRKAHVQNNLQYISESSKIPSSTCREKTHWKRCNFSRNEVRLSKSKLIISCIQIKFCTRWKEAETQLTLLPWHWSETSPFLCGMSMQLLNNFWYKFTKWSWCTFSGQHKFGLFTLFFCRGRCENVLIIKTHVHSHCSSINSFVQWSARCRCHRGLVNSL